MKNLNDARKWAAEQSDLKLLLLRVRGRLARKHQGEWANWSKWARLQWVAAEERN